MYRLLLIMLLFAQQASGQDAWGQEQGYETYRVIAVETNSEVESISNTDTVATPPSLYIPNAFSPDNDGINDRFSARAKGVKDFSIKVYDRWGKTVYASSNPNSEWDGTKDGTPLPVGGYVYEVNYKTYASDATLSKKGTIALIK